MAKECRLTNALMVDLHAQMQENHYQFLKVKLAACFTAIDFGSTKLALDNREIAAAEVRDAGARCFG